MQPNFILWSPNYEVNVVMEDISDLTLDDLCRGCAVHADIIHELVKEGVVDITTHDLNSPMERWRFTGVHLHRAKVAMRLHRDLGVNFAGAALALQLIEELQELKAKLEVLDR